ncbi:MAG: NADH:ubiquinone oxidoreductase subunit NDUFA12 [Micavibrio sp.]
MGLFTPIARLLGTLSPIHIHFVTVVTGARRVGMDGLGNKYYRAKPRKGYKRERRWVIYKGEPEASNVPPEWHGWLHHQTDAVPQDGGASFRRPWQKPHKPNMTGTRQAYLPPGHVLKGGKRDAATGDYEAWKPE